MFALRGRIAVVTGGAKGIGSGISEVLAEAGALVVIAGRDYELASEQASRLAEAGWRATPVEMDVTDEESVMTACEDVVSEFGPPWLLVNNAGFQNRELLLEASTAHWDRIHTVNARGPFFTTREFGRAMAAGGNGGRIVNIASNALRGGFVNGVAAYTASKGSLQALSAASAFELAEHGITVNTILPATVITPGAIASASGPPIEGPAMRPAPFGYQDPREIGAAVLYFASEAARPVTNQILAIDGGFSIS